MQTPASRSDAFKNKVRVREDIGNNQRRLGLGFWVSRSGLLMLVLVSAFSRRVLLSGSGFGFGPGFLEV